MRYFDRFILILGTTVLLIVNTVVSGIMVLPMGNAYKILLDTTIWNATVTLDAALVRRQVPWGDRVISVEMYENAKRVLRNYTSERSSEVLASVARLAEWARAGRVELFDSAELKFEWMNLPQPKLRGTQADAFSNVAVHTVPPPIQRIGFPSFNRADFDKQKKQFLDSIRHPRFLELRKAATNAADGFHLWTAETNGLNCYLTLDERFIRGWRHQKRIVSTVDVLTPQELCAKKSQQFCDS